MSRYIVPVVLVVCALVVTPAALGDDSPPVITYVVTGAAGSNGWYTGPVTITWSVSDPEGLTSTPTCPAAEVLVAETSGVTRTCSASSGGGTTFVQTKIIKIDKTPPSASGANAARAPDANGWYNQPVAIGFGGSDALSGIDSCTSTTYGGPDAAAATVSGTCKDLAGHQSSSVSVSLKFDATPPQLEQAVPDRKPDSAGWYNHAVKIAFAGSDATSGIDACDAPTYTGPDAPEATVSGGCRDKAGNAASASVALRYDGTAPVLRALKARAANGAAVLTWQASADTSAIEVTRTPGLRGAKAALVYRGRAKTFRDLRIDVGRRYRYTVTGRDVAGNASQLVVAFRLPSGLLRPAPGARVRIPPVLAWKRVVGASYYNVQLYRGNRKVLSFWPSGTSFRLRRSWSFDGRSFTLAPGVYRWYVWPGVGARSKQRYGALLGSSTFVVR